VHENTNTFSHPQAPQFIMPVDATKADVPKMPKGPSMCIIGTPSPKRRAATSVCLDDHSDFIVPDVVVKY
jgi:hypothetical protein